NANPIEFAVRIPLLDESNRFFIESVPADFYARRRAEPVEDAGLRTASAPLGVDEIRGLVSALVAAEAQVRQGLFPLLRAGRFPSGRFGACGSRPGLGAPRGGGALVLGGP